MLGAIMKQNKRSKMIREKSNKFTGNCETFIGFFFLEALLASHYFEELQKHLKTIKIQNKKCLRFKKIVITSQSFFLSKYYTCHLI